MSLISTVALARMVPASLEARVQTRTAKNQPVADRAATLFLGLFLISWFVFISIDVFRLSLLQTPAPWVSIVGAGLLITAYGIMLISLWQNSFAVPIVGDQSERDQVLIQTGLYGRVRHPMYSGFLLSLFGLSLWLQSYAAAIFVPIAFSPILARILVEEPTPRETLPGHVSFSGKVGYRLFPFIW